MKQDTEYHHDFHDHDHVHMHENEHEHGDEHQLAPDHVHEHDQSHLQNPVLAWLQHLFMQHSLGHQQAALDPNLATDRGLWALKVSLAALMVTAIFQVVIVMATGSAALLADTIHNFCDALTAVPLGLAPWLSRRVRNRRYTYAYGRAADLAGVVIVLMIALGAGDAIYQSILKIVHPQPITNVAWVAAPGSIGFIGNELVAVFRIRVGKEIGSAALIADGYHARSDGFTSPAVLAGAIAV